MLHILHVTPYYAPAFAYGGVVSAVTGLATAQAARGHRVTVLTTDALDQTHRQTIPRETIDGVEVIRCRNLSNGLHARYNLSLPLGFQAALRHIQPDVIHAHELRTAENLLVTRADSHHAPLIVSPHGTLPYGTGRSLFKRSWDALFARSLLRRIGRVAALTQAEADESTALWAKFGVLFPGAEVIPNGVPADFATSGDLRARYKLGGGPVVLFLGRLHERKGLQFLIPAFAEVTVDQPDARLLIVGPDAGMLAAAQALAARAGIADRVVFTGMLSGADKLAALATADIFALPAVGEGLSMAALEAMAAGLPLIVTPGCNLPDAEARNAGLLVPREVDPLAAALSTLLRDPGLRRVMGANGRAWVHNTFTWPVIAAQTENAYAALIDARSRQ